MPEEEEAQKPERSYINFVRPGKTAKPQPTQKKSFFDGTKDWNMSVDLGK